MKKIFLLLVLFSIGAIAFSQGISVRFIGRINDTNYCRLDSVVVTNITRNWTETVVYPDTIIVLDGTGNVNLNIVEEQGLGQNIPNPFDCETRVELSVSQRENVRMQLLDVSGKVYAEYNNSLDAGVHTFDISAAAPQTYILNATIGKRSYSIRMVNTGSGCGSSIKYAGISGCIISKQTWDNEFQIGDNMRYIGYTNIGGNILESEPVLQPLRENQDVVLSFRSGSTGILNGHEWVDLGLPSGTLWATCNVGANTTEAYGNYYAWGETITKSSFSESNYTYTHNPLTLPASADAATVNWGDGWRMPTKEMAEELVNNSTVTRAVRNGVSGWLITGSNDNSIFLPAAGSYINGDPYYHGLYWTSSIYTTNTTNAWNVDLFDDGTYIEMYYIERYDGLSVRPVCGGNMGEISDASAPTVTTIDATDITYNSAKIQGHVDVNDAVITSRGFYYGTTPYDMNQRVYCGSGAGDFNKVLNGLSASTTYYYKAYATNSNGTSYGVMKRVVTSPPDTPTVQTVSATSITTSEATLRGYVSSDGGATVTNRGFLYGTSANSLSIREQCGSGNGNFSMDLIYLYPGTTYYYKAYATNSSGTSYGEVMEFTTGTPMVQTLSAIGITSTSAIILGYANGIDYDFERGFYYSTDSTNLSQDVNCGNVGGDSSSYTATLRNLTPLTTYYYKAYVSKWGHTFYGELKQFTTINKPTVQTLQATNITSTGVTLYGNVASDNGATVTERGFYYGTSSSNMSQSVQCGSETGNFTEILTVLSPCTIYYYKAYATNSEGTSYGEVLSFTTSPTEPTGYHNGYGYVDLGLPSGVLWATYNVGASSPIEHGNDYAWGEVMPKDSYTWANYIYSAEGASSNYPKLTKYCSNSSYGNNGFTDSLNTLEASDDAATTNWGSNWRIPTYTEMQELYGNCDVRYTSQNGVYGRVFTGINGNCIFLPSTHYWSNSCCDRTGGIIGVGNNSVYLGCQDWRCYGNPVRPVCHGDRVPPSVTTGTASNITTIGVTISGDITFDGGGPVTACGFLYGTNSSELTQAVQSDSVTISFSANLMGLTSSTTYYYKAYATNIAGTAYGELRSFTTVTLVTGILNGHDWVDLGLPSGLLWATCNVGASNPEDYGDGFAWGETSAKTNYSSNTYTYRDNPTTLPWSADAATANWGSGWRMSTSTEIQELLDNCTHIWTTLNGVPGRLFVGPNGNTIFLPAAGKHEGNGFRPEAGSYGNYWSSSNGPWMLRFGSDFYGLYDIYGGYTGLSVRPVAPTIPTTTTGTQNGHVWIDLGLPSGTKWATCNVGANAPEGYGNYYAWGETSTKDAYTWGTYLYAEGFSYNNPKLTKYCPNSLYGNNGFTDTLTTLEVSDDAASANWGVGWQMPTSTEMQELFDNCTHIWTTMNGVNGRLFTGRNGNSIFFPAAGYMGESGIRDAGFEGDYWSSKRGPTSTAWYLFFNSSNFSVDNSYRNCGFPIRPICNDDNIGGDTSISAPTVTTGTASSITATGATLSGNVTSDGGATVTARGFLYGTNASNLTQTVQSGSGIGSITKALTGLTSGTTYYYKAYATNSAGTAYGELRSFTTESLTVSVPTVTTGTASSITATGVTLSGDVASDGGATVTARGFLYGTNASNLTQTVQSGSGTGSFTKDLTGLTSGTTYYYKAYATSSAGTAYGEVRSFTTENTGATTGTLNGHDWVDLGLPSGTRWATCNVGATNPEGYGNYYAWGEITTKETYNWSTYRHCNGSPSLFTKYCNDADFGDNGYTDNLTTLEAYDDAATANWGSGWRMPTYDELNELINNCTVTWTTQNGVNGLLFTGHNGNSIFLPAAGARRDSGLVDADYGYYWSSSLFPSQNFARYLYFCSGSYGNAEPCTDGSMGATLRCRGQSVRPVRNQ